MRTDLRAPLGVAITVQDKRFRDGPAVLAAVGMEADLVDAQLELGGPVADALTYQCLWSTSTCGPTNAIPS